jgi:hypothetical protein
MERNTLLYVALLVSKAARIVIIVALALFVIVLIHWHLDSGSYKGVRVSVDNGSVIFTEGKTDISRPSNTTGSWIYLNDLNSFSRYFVLLQIFVTLVLSYFIVREVIRILVSVQQLQPFNTGNIKSFRRIGYLCLSIATLNCLRFVITDKTSTMSFSVDFTLLIVTLITFILAEIFKEGQKLYEQEKLTI